MHFCFLKMSQCIFLRTESRNVSWLKKSSFHKAYQILFIDEVYISAVSAAWNIIIKNAHYLSL